MAHTAVFISHQIKLNEERGSKCPGAVSQKDPDSFSQKEKLHLAGGTPCAGKGSAQDTPHSCHFRWLQYLSATSKTAACRKFSQNHFCSLHSQVTTAATVVRFHSVKCMFQREKKSKSIYHCNALHTNLIIKSFKNEVPPAKYNQLYLWSAVWLFWNCKITAMVVNSEQMKSCHLLQSSKKEIVMELYRIGT